MILLLLQNVLAYAVPAAAERKITFLAAGAEDIGLTIFLIWLIG